MRELVVIGGGGHGREVLELVEAVNAARPTYRLRGVLDDGAPDTDLLAAYGVCHLGPVDLLAGLDVDYVVAIGSAQARRRVDLAATEWGRRAATLVHPRAIVGRRVTLGPGAVVFAFASVTTNVRIGRHVLLNTAATVAHDCRLGDYVTLAPGARLSGAATVGDGATVGTGAVVIQRVHVGAGTTVGAGAVVVRELPAEVVAIGVPARPRLPAQGPGPG
ncbi:acetyltransferase [Frankia sp. Cpl3]|nr:acetyltransferase [Frankia sp. Cpl3]